MQDHIVPKHLIFQPHTYPPLWEEGKRNWTASAFWPPLQLELKKFPVFRTPPLSTTNHITNHDKILSIFYERKRILINLKRNLTILLQNVQFIFFVKYNENRIYALDKKAFRLPTQVRMCIIHTVSTYIWISFHDDTHSHAWCKLWKSVLLFTLSKLQHIFFLIAHDCICMLYLQPL